MLTTYHIFLAELLANIESLIGSVQSFRIERGDDEQLRTVAEILSDLYDSRDEIAALLTQ